MAEAARFVPGFGWMSPSGGGPIAAPSVQRKPQSKSGPPKGLALGSLDSVLDYTQSFTPSALNPDAARRDPEQGQADLTRAQFDLIENRYAPLEDFVINFASDRRAPERLADEAGGQVASAFDGGNTTVRRLSRFGQSPDREERAVLGRLDDIARTEAIAGTKNTVRQQTRDLQTGLAGDVLKIGQGLSSSASSALGEAAGLASTRERTHDAQEAQHTQNLISSSASGAGLGASLAAAGALGAGVSAAGGAGLGAGAGLLLAMI